MARILLVDDEPRVRQGWRMRLRLEPDMVVVGEADSAGSTLKLAAETQPDVVLLDIRLPDANGIALIRQLHKLAPACKVILVTLYDNPKHRAKAMEAGASDFVTVSFRRIRRHYYPSFFGVYMDESCQKNRQYRQYNDNQ